MIILAFETSCDDTSIALFQDDTLITMNTASQVRIHNKTSWVVPEVAAREHANNIFRVLKSVLKKANMTLKDIHYIAVTKEPGLLTSLLTWVSVASTLSLFLHIPIISIHHIEAHIFANFLEREEKDIIFPAVCLTVSGGHNDIYYMKDMWSPEKLGSSQDDASGEAFDKVAKMMDLGYPGWPIIWKLACEYRKSLTQTLSQSEKKENRGRKQALFPRVWLDREKFDFSFSGLKSAVKREVEKRKWITSELSLEDKKEIAFEFEEAVVEVLAYKIVSAAKYTNIKQVLLTGGVSANERLREVLAERCKEENLKLLFPKKKLYCMDNAAMVAINAYYKIKCEKYEKMFGGVSI